MIGNEWRVKTNTVRFAIKFSPKYNKMKKIWDTHSTYAMDKPYNKYKNSNKFIKPN